MGYGNGSDPKPWQGRFRASVADGFSPSGKVRRRYVYGATEQECKRHLRELRRTVWSEKHASEVDPRTTVKRWIDEWLDDYRERARPKTFESDSGMTKKWIVPALGQRKLKDLTARDQEKLAALMKAGGCAGTTIHYGAALLRRILKAARVAGHHIGDPILTIRLPPISTVSRHAIPAADAMSLLDAATHPEQWSPPPELPHVPYGQAKLLTAREHTKRGNQSRVRQAHDIAAKMDPSRWVAALLQGLRSGEARGLTWDRIDLDNGLVTIDRQLQELPSKSTFPPGFEATHLEGGFWLTPPKSRAGIRRIPLVPWLRDALASWSERQGFAAFGLVWPHPVTGGPLSKKIDLAMWKELQRVAGVASPDGGPYVLHEARHTTVSLLLAADVPESVVISIVGHASFAATSHYAHADLDAARAALMKVQDRLGLELES